MSLFCDFFVSLLNQGTIAMCYVGHVCFSLNIICVFLFIHVSDIGSFYFLKLTKNFSLCLLTVVFEAT